MPDAALSQPSEGAPRQYLTFRVAASHYALPVEQVREVIRVPPLARLPQAPVALLGLANLRGSVLPVVSLRALLGRDGGGAAAQAQALVLTAPTAVALTVDTVTKLVSAGVSATAEAELAATPGERLHGAFRAPGGEAVVKILDISGMLSRVFAEQGPARRARDRAALAGPQQPGMAVDARQLLVTFEVAGQEYALALDVVAEILPAPGGLAAVPGAETVLLGVTAYRERLLPLLSLRALLGFSDAAPLGGREKVIVVPVAGALVGLVADRMRAILRAEPDRIEPTPSMLAARTGGESRIKAVYRGEGGRRLVCVLAPELLFREDVVRQLRDGASNGKGPATAAAGPGSKLLQFLVLRLGEEEFGLPIMAVDEVARVPDKITRVPKTPDFLEGVINMRGEVVPVVDQRKRFDLPSGGGRARRLIVVRSQRHRAGLIVDGVSEVLRAAAETIEPAPPLAGEIGRLVNGLVNLESSGRIIMLLDPAELLSQAERGVLDGMDRSAPEPAAS